MKLNEIQRPAGARKDRKRLGRGESSGQGKTSGRGHKGQKSRSGASKRPWFEGGQMPLQRRLPKRGFNNINRVEYQVVNVSDLGRIKETEVTGEILRKYGMIRTVRKKTKLLGTGDIERAVTVKVNAVTASAREKIEKAGGKIELVGAHD